MEEKKEHTSPRIKRLKIGEDALPGNGNPLIAWEKLELGTLDNGLRVRVFSLRIIWWNIYSIISFQMLCRQIVLKVQHLSIFSPKTCQRIWRFDNSTTTKIQLLRFILDPSMKRSMNKELVNMRLNESEWYQLFSTLSRTLCILGDEDVDECRVNEDDIDKIRVHLNIDWVSSWLQDGFWWWCKRFYRFSVHNINIMMQNFTVPQTNCLYTPRTND